MSRHTRQSSPKISGQEVAHQNRGTTSKFTQNVQIWCVMVHPLTPEALVCLCVLNGSLLDREEEV